MKFWERISGAAVRKITYDLRCRVSMLEAKLDVSKAISKANKLLDVSKAISKANKLLAEHHKWQADTLSLLIERQGSRASAALFEIMQVQNNAVFTEHNLQRAAELMNDIVNIADQAKASMGGKS